MNLLDWLQSWYEGNCDGDWEHLFGVTIETLENPGWRVKVDLEDTYLEEKGFEKIQYNHGDEDWMICYLKDYAFHGEGDLQKLEKILTIFKEWAED